MQTITGKLEDVKKLFGISKNLRLIIGGVAYYGRTKMDRGVEYNLDTLRKNIGRIVEVEFEEKVTVHSDWFIDRALLLSWGIPKQYNEIFNIKIKELSPIYSKNARN